MHPSYPGRPSYMRVSPVAVNMALSPRATVAAVLAAKNIAITNVTLAKPYMSFLPIYHTDRRTGGRQHAGAIGPMWRLTKLTHAPQSIPTSSGLSQTDRWCGSCTAAPRGGSTTATPTLVGIANGRIRLLLVLVAPSFPLHREFRLCSILLGRRLGRSRS